MEKEILIQSFWELSNKIGLKTGYIYQDHLYFFFRKKEYSLWFNSGLIQYDGTDENENCLVIAELISIMFNEIVYKIKE